jgi:uncharacterized protein (TIGR02246 family)
MSTWRCALNAIVIAATAGCATTSPPVSSFTVDDERAVRSIDSTYVAAWLRDDTSAVMNTLAPDVVLMPTGQQILASPNAVRSFWWPADGSHTKILTFQRTIDEVGGEANLAWMRGTDSLVFTYVKSGTSTQMTSRSMTLAVFRKQADGTWRISRMMWGNRK